MSPVPAAGPLPPGQIIYGPVTWPIYMSNFSLLKLPNANFLIKVIILNHQLTSCDFLNLDQSA